MKCSTTELQRRFRLIVSSVDVLLRLLFCCDRPFILASVRLRSPPIWVSTIFISGRRESNPRFLLGRQKHYHYATPAEKIWAGLDSNQRSAFARRIYSPVPLTTRPPTHDQPRIGRPSYDGGLAESYARAHEALMFAWDLLGIVEGPELLRIWGGLPFYGLSQNRRSRSRPGACPSRM
jgi:hypothetical protein